MKKIRLQIKKRITHEDDHGYSFENVSNGALTMFVSVMSMLAIGYSYMADKNNQEKKQLSLDRITTKKLKKLTWCFKHARNLEEKELILRLFAIYYHLESD